ncbi:hypothetical protein UFOVP855_4 [uncultured Caudovirales phage]|jgi:hypothetical protein|uniref:Uncharacterized protein n=1 Tax=uncultured Caudovirales phage TaxID=2100421 RepID=A0A6J5RA66_9CAUD|nr:hypothetical protein UFOVP527_34 [uncultured Caudovirales phage]CAB4167159.1 hypothetical protein UFOVP855_4 [uncultured Caudovirales phage]CAB4173572.1 hypothetical protein UFOVP954_17 [uncultured Caudovirales phage]CAB4179237.1 hypothetical protein UFOVP1026_44 [uncultured Caudovirales phage]CAB4188494.1 hypothetical protein UFOVP1180_28 [uncultured Caudovirales phage]
MNVPNLIIGPMINKDGFLTDEGLLFFQNLVSGLQSNIGQEGYVIPTQSAANIIVIQNKTDVNGNYTCQLGTLIRESGTPGRLLVAMDAGSGVPQFREIPFI